VAYRNMWTTYSTSYWEVLRNKLVGSVVQFGTEKAIGIAVEHLQQASVS
jgi:hypothetical protein